MPVRCVTMARTQHASLHALCVSLRGTRRAWNGLSNLAGLSSTVTLATLTQAIASWKQEDEKLLQRAGNGRAKFK
eukprot:6184271-Pleurochrysis_carterae.AAC.3